jgi:PAS domain S-box-containing protein
MMGKEAGSGGSGPSRAAELEAENALLRAALARAGLDADRLLAETTSAWKETRQGRPDATDVAAGHTRKMTVGRTEVTDTKALNTGLRQANDAREEGRAALTTSEARLRTLFAIRTVGVMFWGPDFGLTEMNDAFLTMTGFSRDEAVGKTWQELTPEEFHSSSHRAVDEVTTHGETTPYEKQYFRKDGSRWWGLFAARKVGDEIMEFVLDVTARREAQEGLRESEEQLRLILENARDYAIFTSDPQDRITGWFAGAAAVFGWPAAEAAGCPVAMLYTPEDQKQGVPEREAETARTNGTAPNVRWHMRRDGSRVFIEGSRTALYGSDGQLRGFLKIGQNVTERRAAEERLREIEVRQSFLLRLSDTLRSIQDTAEIQTEVCRLLGQHLGVARVGFGEIDRDQRHLTVQHDWNDGRVPSVVGIWRMDDFDPALVAEFKNGKTVAIPDITQDPRTSGSQFAAAQASIAARSILNVPFLKNRRLVALLFIHHHEPRGWSSAEVEIVEETCDRLWPALERAAAETALRDQEAALRRLNETLEAQVSARTAELHQAIDDLRREAFERAQVEDSLRQSQKMEAVGQLTGGIAHDFNNMLQGIAGGLELMQKRIQQGRPGEAGRYIDATLQAVQRAAALTHRLLAFARRQTLHPEPVDADGMAEGMKELIRRTVGPGIQVELRLGDGAWAVRCDPGQLENALLNLAINARDAMPEGGKLTIGTRHVRLSATDVAHEESAEPGDYIEVAVTDTGAGMDEATRAHAFEPFFTTKPLGQGTGLGLSQVYGFVRQSSGIVQLDSEPGRGTAVRFYLPRHKEHVEDEETVPRTVPDILSSGEPANSGTVLLVEDEAEVRATAAEHLRDLGYTVLEAVDGPAALRILQDSRGSRLDLLMTDVGLPNGLNGRQVAEAAREQWPGLPVLLITGYAGTALDGQLAPDMDVMIKPFSLDVLTGKIRKMINGR